MTKIPEHIKQQLDDYQDNHIQPKSLFIYCILCDELFNAINHAGADIIYLKAIVDYIFKMFPLISYGSVERVQNYIRSR